MSGFTALRLVDVAALERQRHPHRQHTADAPRAGVAITRPASPAAGYGRGDVAYLPDDGQLSSGFGTPPRLTDAPHADWDRSRPVTSTDMAVHYHGSDRLADTVLAAIYADSLRDPAIRQRGVVAGALAVAVLAELYLDGYVAVTPQELLRVGRAYEADYFATETLDKLQLATASSPIRKCVDTITPFALHAVERRLIRRNVACMRFRPGHRRRAFEFTDLRATQWPRTLLCAAVNDPPHLEPVATTLWWLLPVLGIDQFSLPRGYREHLARTRPPDSVLPILNILTTFVPGP